jgi:hypothetical protein
MQVADPRWGAVAGEWLPVRPWSLATQTKVSLIIKVDLQAEKFCFDVDRGCARAGAPQ